MGRPSKLSDELTDQLVTIFRHGQTSIESACALVGITARTFHNWMKRGKENDPEFVQFFQTIEKARAEAVQGYLTVIKTAADSGQWQAAAWWLERVLPAQYGRRSQIEVLTPDVIEREIARLEAELADNDA